MAGSANGLMAVLRYPASSRILVLLIAEPCFSTSCLEQRLIFTETRSKDFIRYPMFYMCAWFLQRLAFSKNMIA